MNPTNHNRQPHEATPHFKHWRLNPSNLTIEHTQGYGYWVDLEDCLTAQAVLGKIAHIAAKTWAQDPEVIGELVLLLKTLPLSSLAYGDKQQLDGKDIRRSIDDQK